MESRIIEVGISEVKRAESPHILVTRGLGSCVGIAIYDPIKKIGSLAHPMLPDMTALPNMKQTNTNIGKFVNQAIQYQIDDLKKAGCHVTSLKAKICGGACMFPSVIRNSPYAIGQKNIFMAKKILNTARIPLISEDVGGSYGRTILFDLFSGRVTVQTALRGERTI